LHSANSGIEIVNRILAEGLLKREQSKIINGMKENVGNKYGVQMSIMHGCAQYEVIHGAGWKPGIPHMRNGRS